MSDVKAVYTGIKMLLLGFCMPLGCVTHSQPAEMLDRISPAVVAIADQKQTIASGFFVTEDLLLTNEHVLQRQPLFMVASSGKYVQLELEFADKALDVAILRVRRVKALGVLSFREDLAPVGTTLYAIGNPFGTGIATTRGIVSAQPRAIGKAHLLQTDAAINPGNSGGPLVDERGRVVGMVSSRGAVGSGIGFAVPAQTLIPLVDRVRQAD